MTVALVDADGLLILLASFATTLIDLVPFEVHVTEIVLVVDVPLHPAGRVQVNVYPAVPPAGTAVQVNGLPVVPMAQLTVTVTG